MAQGWQPDYGSDLEQLHHRLGDGRGCRSLRCRGQRDLQPFGYVHRGDADGEPAAGGLLPGQYCGDEGPRGARVRVPLPGDRDWPPATFPRPPAAASVSPVGATTVTAAAAAAPGNTATKSFTVTINDTEKPSLTVPANITVG